MGIRVHDVLIAGRDDRWKKDDEGKLFAAGIVKASATPSNVVTRWSGSVTVAHSSASVR
jgi:hypothetical protein